MGLLAGKNKDCGDDCGVHTFAFDAKCIEVKGSVSSIETLHVYSRSVLNGWMLPKLQKPYDGYDVHRINGIYRQQLEERAYDREGDHANKSTKRIIIQK